MLVSRPMQLVSPTTTTTPLVPSISLSSQWLATTSGPKRKRAPTRKVTDTKEIVTAKRAKLAAAASKKSNLADQQSQNSTTFAALKSTRQAKKTQLEAEKAMEAEADKENAPGASNVSIWV